MMSDSDALFAERPDWADVTPVPQHEPNANPIVPIFYTEAYKDATDYFRGIVKKGELSDRVLELTERVIRLNPGHYSAWQYRYQTLIAIKAPLDKELELMDELAEKYLKTYQVWHHRRLLLLRGALTAGSPDPEDPAAVQAGIERELGFIESGLRSDAKNYHTWAYRQWLLAHFNPPPVIWTKELEYVEKMLEEDVRNNSAWHHRFFIVFQSGLHEGEEDRDAVVKRELAFAKEKIALAPNNASAWNYLRGVLDHAGMPYAFVAQFAQLYAVEKPEGQETDESVVDLENPRPSRGAELPCPHAIEFLADVYESAGGDDSSKAISLFRSLAEEHDTIRRKYWEHRIQEVQAA